jgi:hypothetical protein
MKSISCKEAVNFMLRKEEGKLSFWDRMCLWQHLVICSLCRIFLKQNDLMSNNVKGSKETKYHLSEDEKQRIIRNVLSEKAKE